MLRLSAASALSAVLMSVGVSAAPPPPPPTTYYRSIGSKPDYNVGTVTAVTGETHVIGSPGVQWKTANRGRGDRIDIAGVDYTIYSVDAENELTLTAGYVGATTYSEPYNISRKFPMLTNWVQCIEGSLVVLPDCAGVGGASLVADARVEVGVVYNDNVYFMNAPDQLWLVNPITDATHTITLTVTPPNRHHGVRNTGVVLDGTAQLGALIDVRTPFVTIEWIELHRGEGVEQIYVTGIGNNSQIDIHNVIFYDDNFSTHGFHVNDQDANILFFNNVLYGLNHGVHINGLTVAALGQFEFYHNTLFSNMIGLNSSVPSPSPIHNVIIMNGNLGHSNATLDFNASPPSALSGNNWSLDGTGPAHGAGGVGGVPLGPISFVSAVAPENLHINQGSIVEDNGQTLGAVTEDLDGRPRGTPDIGADESDSSSANPAKILTAKASHNHVQLEWQHPDFGPMSYVEIVRAPAAFPAKPSDGTVTCTIPAPAPGSRGQCPDSLSPDSGTEYFYSAFVYDAGGNFSPGVDVKALPFDPAATPPAWTYATDAATFDPAGPSGADVFIVSNDNFFHAMQGGFGASAGEWPASAWAPYALPTTVQQRPVIVDVLGTPTALLGGQDGRVYAISTTTGRLVWKSEVLGTSINAAPAALVALYGATGGGADKVYVGTADSSSNSLHILNLQTGAWVESFHDSGQPANIGAITGVAVKYPSGPVFFTSDNGSGGSPRNMWAIDVSGLPSPPLEVWSDAAVPFDAGPTLYQGLVLVGSRNSKLYAYTEAGSVPLWSTPFYGDGPVKAPIFPVWPNDTVVFTTNTEIHAVQLTATGGCGTAPCQSWTQTIGAGASPPIVIPGTNQAFVGEGNGDLHEISLDLVTPINPPLGTRIFTISSSSLGGPAFSRSQATVYVSDSSGKIHGIPWPIP